MDIIKEIIQHPECIKKIQEFILVNKYETKINTLENAKIKLLNDIVRTLLNNNIIQIATAESEDGNHIRVSARILVIDENKLNSLVNNM